MPLWITKSLTMRGAVVAALPTILLILNALGVQIATEEAQQVVDGILAALGAVGVVAVVIGRVRAQKKIESRS
mgnify:CR=1 FL=1